MRKSDIGWSECKYCKRPMHQLSNILQGAGDNCVAAKGKPDLTKKESGRKERIVGQLSQIYGADGKIPLQSFQVRCRDNKIRVASNMTKKQLREAIEDEFPEAVESWGGIDDLEVQDLKRALRELRMLNQTTTYTRKRSDLGKTDNGKKVEVTTVEDDRPKIKLQSEPSTKIADAPPGYTDIIPVIRRKTLDPRPDIRWLIGA